MFHSLPYPSSVSILRRAAWPSLAVLASLSIGSTGRAQSTLSMGYGEGAPGDTGIQVIVTGSNDQPIHGYSIAFTFPTEALACTEISTAGTHIQTLISNPEFVAPTVDNAAGIGILGVIFDFNEPISKKELAPSQAGSYPRILARLTFNVKPGAPGGVYPLELKDGIGHPASFNRFTNAGRSLKPELSNGTFAVFGGNILQLEKKVAFPGAALNLPIYASASHPQPLSGFQIAFTFAKTALTLKSTTYRGTDLDFTLGDKVEAFNFDVDTSFDPKLARSSVAALFDFAPPFDPNQVLPPSTGSPPKQTLVKYTFDVAGSAADEKQWQDLDLANVNIPGAIDNRFIVGDVGLDPRLVDGKIYFSTGAIVGKIIDADTRDGVSGAKVVTDPDDLTTTTLPNGTFRIDGVPPGKYTLLVTRQEYYSARHSLTEGGQEIIVEGNSTDTNVGSLPLYRVPTGTPCEGDCDKPFIRGNVNGDSRIDLADAVSALVYLFQGGKEPGCHQSADTNDDNKIDLSDAVYLLNYLFAGGKAPPAPFDPSLQSCGQDPTGPPPGAQLTCQQFSCQGG